MILGESALLLLRLAPALSVWSYTRPNACGTQLDKAGQQANHTDPKSYPNGTTFNTQPPKATCNNKHLSNMFFGRTVLVADDSN